MQIRQPRLARHRQKLFSLLCSVLLSGVIPVFADEPAAAHAKEVDGRVLVVSHGSSRTLSLGDEVYAGDTIATLGRARVLLLFRDESKYELGADTRFQIDDYRYSGNGDDDVASTRIVKGLFRYVSGLLARRRPAAVAIRTSVATIGIRGTHVIGEVTKTSARIGLLEPEEGNAPSAIEVSNAYGKVTVDKPGYATEIPDATSPPSPPKPRDLRLMSRNLRAVQTMRRIITPRIPGMH